MGFNHYSLLLIVLVLLFALAAGYLFRLVILALLKYLRSGEARKEKAEAKKTLGEALKAHRTRCKMTQEFVANRSAVSQGRPSASGSPARPTVNIQSARPCKALRRIRRGAAAGGGGDTAHIEKESL